MWWKRPSEIKYKFEKNLVDTKWTITQFASSDAIVGGETYDFKVRARNNIGKGDFTDATSITAVTTPSAPNNLAI